MKRVEEVAVAIAKREEIMEVARNREAEVDAACVQREELIKEVNEEIQWVLARGNKLKTEEIRLEEGKRELEESAKKVQQQSAATTTAAKGLLSCLVRIFTSTYGSRSIL